MTDEDIHNIYTHASGKAEGIAEVTGSADFPVLFARAILELDRMKRTWVGLTQEDRESFWTADQMTREEWDALYQAVEAKLKEKNT